MAFSGRKKIPRAKRTIICQTRSSQSLHRDELPSPWLSTAGEVAHPDAPRGAGGDGRFSSPTALGSFGNKGVEVPHPNSARGRTHALSEDEEEEIQLTTATRQAPPATVPTSVVIKKNLGKLTEVNVTVQIIADGTDDETVTGASAVTELDPGDVAPEYPGGDLDDDGKIKKFSGKITYEGTMTIQTRYRPDISATDTVGYGKGTRPEDKTSGNITIGFHEHAHQVELLNFVTTHNFPKFGGKIGITEQEYNDEMEKMDKAWDKFLDDASDHTYELTDNTGDPTEAEFNAG